MTRTVSLASRGTALVVLLGSLLASSQSCSHRRVTGNPVLVNPEDVSPEIGSTDEIYQATEKAVNSLLEDRPQLARPADGQPTRIVLDRIVDSTGVRDYDERVLYNRFLAQLTRVAGDRFIVLNRDAVRAERQAQLSGEVKTTGVQGALAGADLVLTVELRTLRGARTRTIQYYFQLTRLDGSIVWNSDDTFKKRS